MDRPDVIVVGSGPTGAMAASEMIERGLTVMMVDWGADDPEGRASVPNLPFSEIRTSWQDQRRVFLGGQLEGIPRDGVRVGAQLTPPRQFVSRDGDCLLPIESDSFFPMQSLAIGGLGAAWGTACFTFSREEMQRTGLPAEQIAAQAGRVTAEVGISAPEDGEDTRLWWDGVPNTQPPLDIDSNGRSLLKSFASKHAWCARKGFALGKVPLAVLSKDMGDRRANPCFDMDFYGDSMRAAYRPRYTIEKLFKNPRFSYIPAHLALRFEEDAAGITLIALHGSEVRRICGRRLVLCAGAIGSARIALNSLSHSDRSTTILSNPYRYLPAVNLNTLGRKVDDRRHSLAQLTAICGDSANPARQSSIQIYSYRSLLLFKLVKEMPLPAWAGLHVARTLVNSLVIFGVFSPDQQSPSKTLRLDSPSGDSIPKLTASYRRANSEERERTTVQRNLLGCMVRLGCIPIGVVDPGNGGSIHYAGTIPQRNSLNPRFHTDEFSRLGGFRRVFVGDASSWNWLPCKGLTFTAMCNARRVAGIVADTLSEHP